MIELNRVVFLLLLVCLCAASISFANQRDDFQGMRELNLALQKLSVQPYPQSKYAGLPSKPVGLPKAGEQNAFGAQVTADLQAAYDAYQLADGIGALSALQLHREQLPDNDQLAHWYNQLFEARVFIMMGRAAEVEGLLDQVRVRENQVFKQTVLADAVQGEAWLWLGQYDDAKRYFLKVADALQSWRLAAEHLPALEESLLVYNTTAQLNAYTGLANIALLDKDLGLTRAWADRAEAYYADFHYLASHPEYGRPMKLPADSFYKRAFNLTLLAVSSPRPAQNNYFRQANAFYTAQAYQPGLASNLAYRAYSAFQAGETKQAEGFAKQAAAIAKQSGLPDLLWRVQALLGEIHLKNGQTALAERAFQTAQAAMDTVNGSLSSDRSRFQFGISKTQITARLLEFNRKAGNAAQLFENAERGRARDFVDLLADTELTLSDDGKTNQMVRNLDENIRNLRLKQSMQNQKAASKTNTQINELIAQREGLLDKMAAANPEWAAAYTVRYGTLKQVQERLGADSLLVYSFTGTQPDDLNFMLVTGNSTRFVSIPKGQLALNKVLLDLTDAVALGDAQLQAEALNEIGAVLAVKNWPAAKQVYVVPTGQLHFVPWAALDSGQWVSVLPHGSWLLRVPRNRQPEQGQLVVGDPDFGGDLPQLPGARQEAVAVSRQYNVKPLLGKEATIASVRERSQKRLDVLHFATHGVFNYQKPLQSALFFSGPDGGAQAMTASDVFRQPVRADLVVLSACETGVGQVQPDNDVLGLLRSFYMNGARSAVNTLWPVSDQGVQEFMQVFHASLNLGAGKALSKAVADSKAAGLPPSVYAAFVLNGYTQMATSP